MRGGAENKYKSLSIFHVAQKSSRSERRMNERAKRTRGIEKNRRSRHKHTCTRAPIIIDLNLMSKIEFFLLFAALMFVRLLLLGSPRSVYILNRGLSGGSQS